MHHGGLRLPSEEALREILEQYRRTDNIPGIAVALSIGDEVVAASTGVLAAGSSVPLPVDARFALGCMTKVVTAALVHQMVSRDDLSLDSPLGDLLPDLAGTRRGATQRLGDLLSFQSGYVDLSGAMLAANAANRIGRFAQAVQLFQPGCMLSYEHSGYAIVGDILERVTSTPFINLVQERITDPLGISCASSLEDRTGSLPLVPDHQWFPEQREFRPAPVPQFRPNAAFSELMMSVEQLLCLVRALILTSVDSASRAAQLIPPGAARLFAKDISRVPSPIDGTVWKGIPVAFGMGCAQYGDGLCGFDGGSFGQVCGVRCDPTRGVCLAIGVNVNAPSTRNAVMTAVLKHIGIYLGERPTGCRQSYDFDLRRLVGCYRGSNGTRLEIALEEPLMVFEFRSSESSSARVRIPARYDNAGNTLQLAASGEWRRTHLAVFSAPDDSQPCAACELTAFRKTEAS